MRGSAAPVGVAGVGNRARFVDKRIACGPRNSFLDFAQWTKDRWRYVIGPSKTALRPAAVSRLAALAPCGVRRRGLRGTNPPELVDISFIIGLSCPPVTLHAATAGCTVVEPLASSWTPPPAGVIWLRWTTVLRRAVDIRTRHLSGNPSLEVTLTDDARPRAVIEVVTKHELQRLLGVLLDTHAIDASIDHCG